MVKQVTSRLKNASSVKRKVFSCAFLPDVLCSFRKSESFGVMDRCFECPHYKRFERQMDEEDERVMDEIEKIRKYGYPKRFG